MTEDARFVGIVNVTEDSFSDGGRYLRAEAAVKRADHLIADGADIIDLGAESTHPDSADVPAHVEIERLLPVIDRLRARIPLSVDTWKPETMRRVISAGVTTINDVFALRSPGAVDVIADYPETRVVLMYSECDEPRARPVERPVAGLLDRMLVFFRERLDTLARAGVAPSRCFLDPGMGFFLGANPESSLTALAQLEALSAFGCPIYVSASRKSFLGALTGRPVEERGAATVGAEMFALAHGATYVRTHDVRAIRDAWKVWCAARAHGPSAPEVAAAEEPAAEVAEGPLPEEEAS